jgi:predicted regulator of Ras-like GTPase activity (Roadblock/LC7/MglB family)
MYSVLGELNKTSGVRGSMLVGADGIIIAADLDSRLEDETVGALAASIVSNVSKSLEKLNQQNPDRIMIEADEGKIFLNDAGVGILAVVTDPAVNVGMVRLEIKNAISRIKAQ